MSYAYAERKLVAGPDEPEPPRDFLAIVGRRRPPQQIARAEPEAAPVDQQIPDRDLARHERIPHLEARQVMDDRRVPVDLPFFDEEAKRGGREQLGVRGDAEQRLRIHGRRVAELADAVALRDHDLAVLDDREREAREPRRRATRAGRRRRDPAAPPAVRLRQRRPEQTAINRNAASGPGHVQSVDSRVSA